MKRALRLETAKTRFKAKYRPELISDQNQDIHDLPWTADSAHPSSDRSQRSVSSECLVLSGPVSLSLSIWAPGRPQSLSCKRGSLPATSNILRVLGFCTRGRRPSPEKGSGRVTCIRPDPLFSDSQWEGALIGAVDASSLRPICVWASSKRSK